MTSDAVFNSMYEVDEWGCWIWLGSTHGEGYGNFFINGQPIAAHRYSWQRTHPDEVLPSGKAMQIHHTCDQPACVNPDHLELVTAAYNSQQRKPYKRGLTIVKERRGGGCPHGHGPESQFVRSTDGATVCRECYNAYQREWRRKTGKLKGPREIKHGTNSGYGSHKYRGEMPCDPCKEAHRTYAREYARRRAARGSG